jgi:RNA polymerase sigma-70 factor (ECF subfamily)
MKSDRSAEDEYLRRLLGQVAQNLDRAAFSQLFDQVAPRVKSFMLRKGVTSELAEDLVQDTMIAVWTKAGLFDAEKGSVITWIFTIARNLRIDKLRRDKSSLYIDIDDFDAESGDMPADDVMSARQDHDHMTRALTTISEEQKQILMLSYVDDVPQSEIAQRLNLPLGTVKSRMRLAYGHLRRNLETLR